MVVKSLILGPKNLKTFIKLTVALAVINILGEIFRSWGDGRNIVWILDDVLAGLFLIVASLMFTKDTLARRSSFAAAWGVSLGMIYMSFFSSLLSASEFNSGNLDWRFLLAVKGFIFLLCLFGVFAAIRLPYKKWL